MSALKLRPNFLKLRLVVLKEFKMGIAMVIGLLFVGFVVFVSFLHLIRVR